VRKLSTQFLREGEALKTVFIGSDGEVADGPGALAANKAVSQRFIQARDDVKDEKLYDLLNELCAAPFTSVALRWLRGDWDLHRSCLLLPRN
jgi:hypothetical protein